MGKGKIFRKYAGLMGAMALLLCAAGGMKVQAASAKAMAKTAYNSYMAGAHSNLKFALIYLDKDSVPELVVSDGKIYTYKKASGMVLLQDDYEFDYQKYYKKKGVIYSDIIPGAVMDYDVGYYQRVKGKKLATIVSFNHFRSGKWEYFNSKYKKINKNQFKSLIKKYAGSRKLTKIKYYQNTPANRNRYL